ncbi:PTS fructose transporter subunit IIC [Raineyella sp. LH-20]|uniref:PTS fructose transporter subunit IIC n=1 Tax=Raineyella sp. LH-20 TaxID=3081204 RepID=UPI002952CC71|nr:PTS fructose transporter subunit IIC [Raineyella sp. LH-20]WOP19953.1 PTS fructose transporter subunit IIC [Raineyella sp. LH-20]
MVVAGGLLQSITTLIYGPAGANTAGTPQDQIRLLGASLMVLLVPMLAAYIAYGIADKAALIPGLVGGIAAQGVPVGIAASISAGKATTVEGLVAAVNAHVYPVGSGFIGGVIAGLAAGYLIKYLKKIPYPQSFAGIVTLVFYPLIGSFVIGALMLFLLGGPAAAVTTALTAFLKGLQGGSLIVLGLVLGAVACTDMGGPINKSGYLFAVYALAEGNGAPYAAFAAAKCIPPIAVALSSIFAAKGFTDDERDTAKGVWLLGMFGITEGAIPFALRDPIRIIAPSMIGGGIAAAISLTGGSSLPSTGGSVITIPITQHPLNWIAALVAGLLITTVGIVVTKRMKVRKHGPDRAVEEVEPESVLTHAERI